MHGNDGLAFCRGDLTAYWESFLGQPFIDTKEREILQREIAALNELRSSYRKLLLKIGGSDDVGPEEIEVIGKDIKEFMVLWRAEFATIAPKLHVLEDHVVQQLHLFRFCLGLINEQGGEGAHAFYNKIVPKYANMKDAVERCKAMVEHGTISTVIAQRKQER